MATLIYKSAGKRRPRTGHSASNSCMRPVQRTNEERNWIQPAGEQDGPSLYPIRAPRPAARQGKNSGRSTCGLYIATCNNLASEAPGVWIVEGRSRCPHGAPCRLPRQPRAIAAALDAVARLIVIRQRSPCSDIYSGWRSTEMSVSVCVFI